MSIIAIPGWSLGENSYGATKTYLKWASKFGSPRIIMPDEEFVECNLLILPGGPDLNPANYGKPPDFHAGSQDAFKEYFFRERLQNYVGKVPIFGICLGFQMLNVFFKGKLEQHLLWHPQSPERWTEGHKVRILDSNHTFEVNSHHHQGVLQSQVSPEMEVLAVEDFKKSEEKNDKVVEALHHKLLPVAGVQWHPEEWYDMYSTSIVEGLLGKF